MTADETPVDQPAKLSGGAVKRERATQLIRQFLRAHGALSQATVVVENLGRRGARVVMVGADGRWGDVVVATVEDGVAACQAAGVDASEEWDRDVIGKVVTTSLEWTQMAQGQVLPPLPARPGKSAKSTKSPAAGTKPSGSGSASSSAA